MLKEKKSQIVSIDKIELTKSIIYKLEDPDDLSVPTMYFTLRGLKTYVLDTIWDYWEETIGENEKQDFTKMQIIDNDEFLFAYLESWMYRVGRIIYQDVK